MILFEKAVDTAKKYIRSGKPLLIEQANLFNSLCADVRIFVFNESDDDTSESEIEKREFILDLPFKTCWFESRSCWNLKPSDVSDECFYETATLIHEESVGKYMAFKLYYEDPKHSSTLFNQCGQIVDGPQWYLTEIGCDSTADGPFISASQFIDQLKKYKLGSEKVDRAVKLGTKSSKASVQIRDIIHVSPKRLIEKTTPAFSKNIDWSHRFEVRGHWRKTMNIGKDREGKYRVNGFTWVKDCVKGPANKPLVKKTRLVGLSGAARK